MSLRRFAWRALILAFPAGLWADLPVQISVDPGSGNHPISPYVYGTDQDMAGVAAPGARRLGGNRLTGYNWETNASNAGTDYLNQSDNYMVSQLPAPEQGQPAIALTLFHDQSLAAGTPYTVLTLQMAGYVAADENGPVSAAEAAPSPRWDLVQNDKPGGVYADPPDLSDGKVYMDELLSLLVHRYGPASGNTGVRGYNLDNEPALWPSTHPYLHPAATTCAELIGKSVALAKAVKRMDASAEVLGPVLYGSEAYFTLQSAPDWPALQASTGYRWFIDYYLDQMRQASAAAGMRLLDVLDLHRYSDENVGGAGGVSITGQTDFSDTATDMERVQAPRVLWDASYVENSWVQLYDPQFLPWIPNLQASINARYPGTELSFTEYSYGGESDISGGIAEADVLGIYGKYGVYLGCVWILHGSPPPVYMASAFNLYLNYDGKGGRFGATSVSETDSDTVNSSAYASVDSAGAVHVVVLNKSFTQTASIAFQIAGPGSYTSAQVYAFDGTSPVITARAPAAVAGNKLAYALAPLTAAHFVFQASPGPPQFTAGPASQAIAGGSTVVFSAAATGSPPPGLQWLFNGNPLSDGGAIAGASSPTLVISGASAADAGTYSCAATNSAGSATSSPAALTVVDTADPGRLVNISCRAQVGTGDGILIAGFVVGGAGTSGPESLLARGSGPALAPFGVAGSLADPQLRLYSGATALGANSGWGGNAQIAASAASVGAFPWNDPSSHDSALLEDLQPGAYTAQVSGQSGDTGVALVEVYDATPAGAYTAATPRLVNVSARVQVGTGEGILIAGFVVGGSTSRTVLLRASGPALTTFGVAGALPDPRLQLYSGSTLLGTNSGWGAAKVIANAAASVGAFAWGGSPSNDSAILVTLPPGAYTAQVSGASGDTGVALVEVYEVP